MVWRRLFRGRSTTTEVEESQSAPEAAEAEVSPPAPPAPAPAPPPARPGAAPRFGGFSFENPAEAAPTVEAPVPEAEAPGGTAQVAAAVRRKAGRRAVRVAERGVRPVLVPSLREQALLYRMAAEDRAAEQPEAALAFWKAYLELCPEDGASWFLYGQCLLARGLDDAAWGAFVETRRRLPTHGLAAGALGYLSAARGDHDEAVRHYRDATVSRPECLDMLTGLAQAQERTGRLADARATRARIKQLTDDA